MTEIAEGLSKAGFFTVSIDYRLAPVHRHPTQFEDAQAAVRYLRTHASELGIKPNKIGALGFSAGGHLSMLLGTREGQGSPSSRVQAVGSISGIHDLNEPLTSSGERYGIVQALLGEKGKPDKVRRKEGSPVTYVDAATAPTMFIQGKIDPLVPPEQSLVAVKALKDAKVKAQYLEVEGMGHGLQLSRKPDQEAFGKMVKFLHSELK